MAGTVDALRGDGLTRAQEALAELEEDPQRLRHARVRFEESTPPRRSDRYARTRSVSPDAPSEKQQSHHQRRTQVAFEWMASEPYEQFAAQTVDEEHRVREADRNGTERQPVRVNFSDIAYNNVKKRWVEQGLWSNKWGYFALGRWKHEEPLEVDSEPLEVDSEPPPSPPLFGWGSQEPPSRPRQPKSDEEKRQAAERRVIREREREASRPYHQFFYQVSKECERIHESLNGEGGHDVNTRAYKNVKRAWTKRKIWDKRWGVLPGMSWKHEVPFEDYAAYILGPQASPIKNSNHKAESRLSRTPSRGLFGSCTVGSKIGPYAVFSPPVESSHGQAPSISNAYQNEPATDIDSAGVENGNGERLPSARHSPLLSMGEWVLCPEIRQAVPSTKNQSSDAFEQLQPVASTSHGPNHPSNASKVTTKKQSGLFGDVSYSSRMFVSATDSAKPPPSPAHEAPGSWLRTGPEQFLPFPRNAESDQDQSEKDCKKSNREELRKTPRGY